MDLFRDFQGFSGKNTSSKTRAHPWEKLFQRRSIKDSPRTRKPQAQGQRTGIIVPFVEQVTKKINKVLFELDDIEEENTPAPPKKRGPGRPPKPECERKRKPKGMGKLWEFIRNLLLDPETCPSLVRWEDAQEGIFRIVQSEAIANKWGMRKSNEKMNYEKLSRAMRYYYKAKIFEPVLGKRLVYKFGPNAKGWTPLNPNSPNFES